MTYMQITSDDIAHFSDEPIFCMHLCLSLIEYHLTMDKPNCKPRTPWEMDQYITVNTDNL